MFEPDGILASFGSEIHVVIALVWIEILTIVLW